ncbi:GTP-binding protein BRASSINAZOLE INSENSITIVE PALE GREEN 2, chloroplastic, partial [Linum perenne]
YLFTHPNSFLTFVGRFHLLNGGFPRRVVFSGRRQKMHVLLSTSATKFISSKLILLNPCAQEVQSSRTGLSTGLRVDRKNHERRSFSLVVKSQIEGQQGGIRGKIGPRKGSRDLILSEGRDEDEKRGAICPGCGVFMQDREQDLPGYFQPRRVTVELGEGLEEGGVEGFDWDEEEEGEEEEEEGEIGDEFEESNEVEGVKWDYDEIEAMLNDKDDDLDLDGFTPAGVGYGNITEEVVEKEMRRKEDKKVSKAERKRAARETRKDKDDEVVSVCARCHSLRNYGQVKNQSAENLIPDFDFNRLISTRLIKPVGNANASVVIMVVDCVDFDGSFPKRAAKSLFEALEGVKSESKSSKKLPKLVLVATKVDLLPSQISPARLDRWVRHRARAAGAPKLAGVYLVSSRKDLGVKNLLSFVKELAGPRGNVWVIGAQNAGKSTLINALAKKEGAKVTKLTEAPVPGTTLGILRIGGILSAKAKMYDTPGLLHPNLMSMRLNREEQKMVEIRKELKPRSYRVKVAGTAIHVGGLARLDLIQASVETIYITVWASPSISLHMGKLETADEFYSNHVGVRLQPPVGIERAEELGEWESREIKVTGSSWDVNSIDISIAGLGWFSIGLKGEATLSLRTFDSVEITLRDPLVLDRATFLERPGFWLPLALSDALGNQKKLEAKKKKKQPDDYEESLELYSELAS